MSTIHTERPRQIDFLPLFQTSIAESTFIKLTLAKYRGKEPELERIIVKRVKIKNQDSLSFVYRYKTRDITKNYPIEEGEQVIETLLGTEFKSGHLFTTGEDVQIEYSKKGKMRMNRAKATKTEAVSTSHDRKKERLLDPATPFLHELGIADKSGQIIPSMSRKWKQINKFLEIFSHALESSELSKAQDLHVVDFGSGKGYLTFAVYHYLQHTFGTKATVTGVELREDLVNLCNGVATRLGMEGLNFRQGDIRDYKPERIDIMIALHACDTATDLAMHQGITTSAEVVMCAPCCHKEVRPQIQIPEILQPMLQHGAHLGQEADMVTDSLRALLLEASSYKTSIFEFVSLEHTSKNKMVLAVKRAKPVNPEKTLRQIEEIKQFYGIQEQTLEKMLREN